MKKTFLAEDLRSFNHRLLGYLNRYNGQRQLHTLLSAQLNTGLILSHMW